MTKPIFNKDNLSEKPAIEQLKRLGYDVQANYFKLENLEGLTLNSK